MGEEGRKNRQEFCLDSGEAFIHVETYRKSWPERRPKG